MEGMTEKIIKLILVLILVMAGLFFWFLPKTRLAKRFKANETLFIVTNIIGMICGVIGLVVTFVWPRFIVELHLWELILIPFVLVYVYWGIIMRVQKSSSLLDEKQVFDMTNAGAATWVLSIPAMAILFILYERSIISGIVWFPCYLFSMLLFFSTITLFTFKR